MTDTRTPSTQRPATLTEVAQLAGVSLATASKAINGKGQVAPATRTRVMEAADTLSFTPNQVARNLLLGRTGTVGLMTSDLEGRFMIPILMGAEDAFGAGEVNVFLCDARGDAIREQHHLRALLNRRVDGIIVVGDKTNARRSLGQSLPVPVVYAYAPSDDPADDSVVPDNAQGGRLAVEHLVSIGRTKIAHISGDPTYAAAADRAAGVRDGLRAAGLELVGDVASSNWSEHWGRDACAMLLSQHPEIDGIVCASDQLARGAIDTLRELGRRVPEDVAIIGHDNWEILATNSRPELTSIDPGLQELGRTAARRIFDAIDGRTSEPEVLRMPMKLIIRGSTIPARR